MPSAGVSRTVGNVLVFGPPLHRGIERRSLHLSSEAGKLEAKAQVVGGVKGQLDEHYHSDFVSWLLLLLSLVA